MTAMHLVRPGARQLKAQAATLVPSYPPGHFTAPVRAWWPDWKSKIELPVAGRDMGSLAQAARESAIERGTGWGRGTMVLPRTPKQPAPGWI